MNVKALTAFRETDGWCPLNKAEYLCSLISEHKPLILIEIGVYAGKSLFPMAITIRVHGGKAIGIEPFSVAATQEGTNPADNDVWWSRVNFTALEYNVRRDIGFWGLEETVKLIKKTSKEALAEIPHNVGLIHQDSNHSEEVSFWETEHYAPLLAKGGFYVLDDIEWNVDGKLTNAKSIALLDELFTRVKWVEEGADQWGVWQK